MTAHGDDRAWLRDHPLVFVDDLDSGDLSADDDAHLRRSLRLRPGAPLTLGDGAGRWRRARLAPAAGAAEPEGPVLTEPEPVHRLTVAFTPVKGQKPEWVVQKLTELGIDRIVVLRTDRTVVRWDDTRAERQLRRWDSVVREAAMQSRRLRLPAYGPPVSVSGLVQGFADEGPVHLAEPGGESIDAGHRVVAIGPEGGWSPAERDQAPWVGLPGGILRADTAVVAAAALMAAARQREQARWG